MKKKKSKRKKLSKLKKLRIFTLLTFGIKVLALIGAIFYPKKRIQKFLKEEKREIKEVTSGKESFKKFCSDSLNLFKDFLIPHPGNEHKPKALRPKSLLIYVILAIFIKLAVTGFLFFTYPTLGELSQIITTKIIQLTNQTRLENNISPLQVSEELTQAALKKAQDMLAQGYFSHNSPDGKRPWQWIDRSEYDYVYAGENLAMGFTSAELIHNAFIKSPTHRKNILNPKYQDIGVAVISGQINGEQTDILVQFFGTLRSELVTLEPTQQPKPLPETITEGGSPPLSPPEVLGLTGQEVDFPSPLSEGVIVVTTEQKGSKTLVDLVIEYSNIFFMAFLIFIVIALVLNIFIKIKIQHTSLIYQTIIVIALISALILVKFHFIEKITPQLLIL